MRTLGTLFFFIVLLLFGSWYFTGEKEGTTTNNMVLSSNNPTLGIKKDAKLVQKELLTQNEKPQTKEVVEKKIEEKQLKNEIKEELQARLIPKKGVSVLQKIDFEKKLLDSLVVGDIVRIPLDGASYDVELTKKEEHANGDASFFGTFKEDGKSYDTVLTRGSKYSFISMNTPKGNREVEMAGNKGLVYSSQDIRDAYIDYGQDDTKHAD